MYRMNLKEELDKFYATYHLPENGGVNDKTFGVPLPFFPLTLPNFNWRRKRLYIHDLEHILNKQDTTWRGEMFIASWEIATGFWRYFPLCIFPLWTMGFGLWKHPSSVYKGFNKGSHDTGIAALNFSRENLLLLKVEKLHELTENKKSSNKLLIYLRLLFWSVVSTVVFLSPLIVFISTIYLIMK